MKLAVLLLVCSSLLVQARQPQDSVKEIKGAVADSLLKTSLTYVTVSLKDGKKQLLKTTLSQDDGAFVFTGLQASTYSIHLVCVGYRSKSIDLDLTDSASVSADLGKIYLSPLSNHLKEIVVTGEKPIIKQEIDRISYNLQADPESKVMNVLEMMRKVPMLSLDADDNIQLKGNSNYKILINGRPSGMVERNPKDILRSMPASTIERIEVITTPPAKYDGEGLAGIINIVTSKKVDNGYSGSFNINERFPVGGPGAGGNITVKSGRVGVSINAGGNLYDSPFTESANTRVTLGAEPNTLHQSGKSDYNSRSAYFNGELSFEIDSLNLISGQFSSNRSRSGRRSDQLSHMNTEALSQGYELATKMDGRGGGSDVAFNYQKGFKGHKNRLLTLSYKYYSFSNEDFNDVDVVNAILYNIVDYRQNNISDFSEQTFQLDYVHDLRKINIEAGIKGVLRENSSDFQYLLFQESEGIFVADPSRSNEFNNSQHIFSVYSAFQYSHKSWGFKGGLRVENTRVEADFISTASGVQQDYLNFIPSASVNRKLSDNSSLNLGYSVRVQRPTIFSLNPFVDRSNPSFERSGNPDLRPTTGNMFQLNYGKFKKSTVNIGLSYMLIKRLIMPMSTFQPESNITRTTYGNTGRASLWGLDLNARFPLTKSWNYSINGTLNYGKVEGEVNGVRTSNEGFMPRMNMSSDYRFPNGWRFSANLNYNGSNISLQGKSNDFTSSSFSLSRAIMKEKINLSVATSNPFAKYRDLRNSTEGFNFIHQSYNQNYLRSVTISMNYRFGSLKEGIKKNKRGIRNDDVSSAGNNQ